MSRLLSVALLAVLIAPSALAECRPVDGVPAEGMDCCHKVPTAGAASLDADCCALKPGTREPVQATTPATGTRTIDPGSTVVATTGYISPANAAHVIAAAALDTSPPSGPLYLRLSTIRR